MFHFLPWITTGSITDFIVLNKTDEAQQTRSDQTWDSGRYAVVEFRSIVEEGGMGHI